jgi:hypothetical protein
VFAPSGRSAVIRFGNVPSAGPDLVLPRRSADYPAPPSPEQPLPSVRRRLLHGIRFFLTRDGASPYFGAPAAIRTVSSEIFGHPPFTVSPTSSETAPRS